MTYYKFLLLTGPLWDPVRNKITNLEGSYESLEKEVESLKGRLDERDEAIAELRGAVDFLTNKRCRCNDDKVSPCS